MAVIIPTIQELTDQILNDIATEFSVDVSELGKTYQVWAKVQAGMQYQIYLGLSAVQKNVYFDLAEQEILLRYGEIILGRGPAPAESGEYTLEVIGEIGAVIAAGTQFKANDNTLAAGFLFVLDAEYTLIATTDSIAIRALTPGTESRLNVDDLVTATAPIADVNSEGKITAVTKQPVAAETIEAYRSDVIEASRLEPQGGAPSDYRLWASEVTEVRTVYPYVKEGNPGDIEIFIEATEENTAPAEITGVPTQETIDKVYKPSDGVDPESGAVIYDEINLRGRKPLTVFNIFPLAVNPIPVDLYFIGLSDESKADDIRTVVDALLYDIRPFVAGAASLSEKNDILTIGQIIAVVINLLSGSGVTYTDLTIQVDGSTVTSYTFEFGFYPYLRLINNDGSPI